MNNNERSDMKNNAEYIVKNGVRIGFEDFIQELRSTTGATPLKEGELYYRMDTNLAVSETSSYGAIFKVKAKSSQEAIDRAKMFLLSKREHDDTGLEISWITFDLHYKPDTLEPEVEIFGDPYDEEEFLKQNLEYWLEWVRDYKNGNALGFEEPSRQSMLSEWKWPIISIPIIIIIILFLEYVSNQ